MVAVKEDGSAWIWGDWRCLNEHTTPTVESMKAASQPCKIMEGVASAAAGNQFFLFVKADKTLWGIGDSRQGQLGVRDTNFHARRACSHCRRCGRHHSCFIKSGGPLWCMGANHHGQLGDGTFTTVPHGEPRS